MIRKNKNMFINIQLFAGGMDPIYITLYTNDGSSILYSGDDYAGYEVTSTGLHALASDYVWTYSGNDVFLGFATSPNQTTPTYAINDYIGRSDGGTLYVVTESSQVTYEYINYNSHKVQVDSAIRDGNGNKIDAIYATKNELTAKQDTLVSGTNIKTINNESLLGSGNISISSGQATTVKINGTSITSNNEADIKTSGTYNASTNKIATMSDVPATTSSVTSGSTSALTSGGAYTNLVSDITYDSTNKKIQKTKNGSTTDLVTFGANAFNSTTIPTSYVSSVNGNTGSVTGMQTTSNLVTSISSSSTDTQYPSAKCVYDTIGDIETLLTAINSGNGVQ